MKKRFIAGVLGIMMLATLLAGCGKKSDSVSMWPSDTNEDQVDVITPWTPETGTTEETQEPAQGNATAGATDDAEVSTEAVEDGMCWDVETECDMSVMEAPYMPYEPYGNEEYGEIEENGFLSVAEQPLSTFSADVDTASYSNLRRMILDGYELDWIPEDSVRIEEMINYFDYDYSGPKAGEPFGVNTEIAQCPWNEDSYVMMVGLQTEEIDFSDAAPSNLVFLIDVSGSMYSEDKLPLLQKSFAMLATNLTAKDRVSIVTYAGDDRIVLQGARGNDVDTIVNALNNLEAGGSTNGSAGISTAYELAEEYFIEGGNNRVILATDGDLNVGLTSEDELEWLITQKRETGVFLSVLGFGTGNIKDNKMETLADCGNGNYAYIDSLNEARKVLVEEMGATLVTVAKDVKFQMEFNPDVVAEYRLIGYENRALANEDFTDDTKDAGEIGAGHSVTVLYEVKLVPGEKSYAAQEWSTLHIRYKAPEADESRQLDYVMGSDRLGFRASEDLQFACCVAQFGMLLRDSDYAGSATYEGVYECLEDLRAVNTDEYKKEFLEMVQQVMWMADYADVCGYPVDDYYWYE